MTKTCSKCGEEKPEAEFPAMGRKCRACIAEYGHEYYKANREKLLGSGIKRASVWRLNNPEKNRKTALSWRMANKEKTREKDIKYKTENSAKIIEWSRIRKHRARERCYDCYIKEKIKQGSALRNKDIPDSLVRLKRAHIKLLREVKKHGNQERTAT